MIFRKSTAKCVILGYLLRYGESSGAQISKFGFIGSAAMYPTLMDLEREGWLQSRWLDEPYPRRKLYSLAGRHQL